MSSSEEDLSSTETTTFSDSFKDFANEHFWSPPSLSGSFYVFWGRDDEDDEIEPTTSLFPPTPETLSNQPSTKAAMKDFLKELELEFFPPFLVQFWRAKSKGGNWVLTTSDQPFGVNIFDKGLASYRSHCVNNNYVISDIEEADDIGPHVRVFRDKCLELSPDARYYSVKDYPQREDTIFVAYGNCWLCQCLEIGAGLVLVYWKS